MMNRRDFARLAAAALPAAQLFAKPNSKFAGVQVGAITYSFRALPSSAEQVLGYLNECGISAIELMSNVAESFAGAPLPQMPQMRPGGPPPAGPRQMTPEQLEARKKAAAELSAWRASAPMTKYKEFRKMYEKAGVKIYAFKLPPTLDMSDAEYAYIWNVAETLGANHITMELPTDDKLLARVAQYAEKRKLAIAFHTHGQGGSTGFDRVLNASQFTALNFDVGHYFGVNGESPVPLVEKYHERIASLHLKDRKGPSAASENRGPGGGGPNMPWGEGGTPLKEVLQLMRAKKYKFPASIEYEYNTPEGSNVVAEMKKCVEYCRKALA